MRVVVGVHYRTTNSGTEAHIALTTGLTDLHICMIGIANHANGSHAVAGHVAQLAGGQTQQCVRTFQSHQLCAITGRASQLCTVTGIQLHVVYHGTNGNVLQRQSVTGHDVYIRTGYHGVAYLQAFGSGDVALHAVLILDESDVRASVGIILNALDLSGNIELVALEVDHTVFFSVTAATMTNGDSAVGVAAGLFVQRLKQRTLRSNLGQRRVIGNRHIPSGRRSRLISFDCHSYFSFPDNFAKGWLLSYLITRNHGCLSVCIYNV